MTSTDVEKLFRQFSITDVKDVERKIKIDIEKKKEDLRQMVGRRYQDIIEAADSISDMKHCSDSILDALRCVQQNLAQLEALQSQLKSSRLTTRLIIMAFTDKNLCLDAAWLYSLADYVYRTIGLQNNFNWDTKLINMSWKIIVDQLVDIEKGINSTLISVDRTTSEYDRELDALCAAVILRNINMNGALNLYLSSKETALKSIFDNKEVSGRLQICSLVHFFQTTVFSLAKLLAFDAVGASGIRAKGLMIRMQDLNDGIFQSDMFTDYLKLQSSRTSNSLPHEIKEFRCCIRLNEIDNESLQKMCNIWLSRCVESCRATVSDCLSYFASVDALSTLKNSVQEIIIKGSNCSWNQVCDQLFGRKFNLWNELIAEFLTKQLEDLVLKEVDDYFMHFEGSIEEYISTYISRKANRFDDDLKKLKINVEEFLRDSNESMVFEEQNFTKFRLNSAHLWVGLARHLKILVEGNVFIAKVCACVTDLMPTVKELLAHETSDQSFWISLSEKLQSAMFIALCKKVEELSKIYLPLDLVPDVGFWLDNAMEWDSIEIYDEVDSGRKVVSTISVPMFISPYLANFLNDLCNYMCIIGPHVIPRDCITKANFSILTQVINFYAHIAKFHPPDDQTCQESGFFGQKQALQAIFDLKYLEMLLDTKQFTLDTNESYENPTECVAQLGRLITKIESVIDPFDWDTMRLYLKRNISKLMQKCQAIYDLLLTQEAINYQQSCIAALKNETNAQQMNTLDPWQTLSMCDEQSSHGRFRLLPVYDPSDRQLIDEIPPSIDLSHDAIALSETLKNSTSPTSSLEQLSSLDVSKIGSIPSLTSIYEQRGPALELWSRIWECSQQQQKSVDLSSVVTSQANQTFPAGGICLMTTLTTDPPPLTTLSSTSESSSSSNKDDDLATSPRDKSSEPTIAEPLKSTTVSPSVSGPATPPTEPIPPMALVKAPTNAVILAPALEYIPLTFQINGQNNSYPPGRFPPTVINNTVLPAVMPSVIPIDRIDPPITATVYLDPAVRLALASAPPIVTQPQQQTVIMQQVQ